MENDPRFRAATLAALLARYYPEARPHAIGHVVYLMQNAARSAVAWETKRCNVPMSEKQEEAGKRRLIKLAAEINGMFFYAALIERCTQAAHTDPARVELGGDPRGPCARLHIPGMAGEGFAIY